MVKRKVTKAIDVIAADKPCLQQMVEAHAETGGNIVAAMEVPKEKTSSYGILDIKEDMGSMVSVKGMVEKPKAEDAHSNLAVIGRYILTPQVLQNLNRLKSGAGGEIQLTDAIADELENDRDVYGGLERPELKDEFGAYLEQMIATRQAAQ